jgi:hypothetical protein
MKSFKGFCDLMCEHAEIPDEQGLDGSHSCMTFVALYCMLKGMPVYKNMPCNLKD